MGKVRPQIYETTPVAEIIKQLRREVMPVPFIRRMRVINILSAVTLRKIEDKTLLPFDVMDIHHVLDKQISQDAIIAILENEGLAIAIDSGNLQPLWEESANLPLLRKGFEQGWIQRFILLPFDPICIMLALRAKLLLDAVDEFGHSYNLIRSLGLGWIDFGDLPGEEPGDPDSYLPPGIDVPIDYPDQPPPPSPGEPGYVPGPGDPGYIPPSELTPSDPGYTTTSGSPGYVPPSDPLPGEPGYIPGPEPVTPEIIPDAAAIIEAPPPVPIRKDILSEGLAAPLHIDLLSKLRAHAIQAAAEAFYFDERFYSFTDNPWSKYTTGSASAVVDGGILTLDNAYVGTACRVWCNLAEASPGAWTANFRAKITRPLGDSALIVTFYMDNGYAQLWLKNDGTLYMIDATGNTNFIEDIVPLDVFISWQVYSMGDYYWVYKNKALIGGPISIRSPSGRKVKLEQNSEGYSEIDEVIITY